MDEVERLAEIISTLEEVWTPHEGQVPIGSALFYGGVKNIFIQAGRNWGKTELCAYSCTRWAMQFPGTESYIFEPFQNQAREILWESRRLQNFVPDEWKDSENNTDMRIRLTNGSFIKLDGADNEESRRGIKPGGLIIYDEFKDHKRSFTKAMEPNRAAFDVPALFIGTPPPVEGQYTEFSDYAKESTDWRHFHAPTRQNPHISHAWLEREKARLIAMGDEEEWLREYEAIFVKGGKNHLLPQFLTLKHKALSELLQGARS